MSDHLSPLPHYTVSLDDPPSTRWNHVVTAHIDDFEPVLQVLEHMRSSAPVAFSLATCFLSSSAYMRLLRSYVPEIQGIAAATKLPFSRILAMTLNYEAAAFCTSVVCSTPWGTPVLIRSMDWELPALKRLTVHVTFTRNGKPLFQACTWVGYVGVLTGMRLDPDNGYAVAVNYRRMNAPPVYNLFSYLVRRWPIGFAVRHCLETHASFAEAETFLSKCPLIAPTYFTLVGTKSNEGVILTRSRKGVTLDQPLRLREGSNDGVAYLVQVNCDCWVDEPAENILWSVERRDAARRHMESLMQAFKDDWEKAQKECEGNEEERTQARQALQIMFREELRALFATEPVLNETTIYVSEIVPADLFLESWVSK